MSFRLLAVLLAAACCLFDTPSSAQEAKPKASAPAGDVPANPFPNRVPAVELEGGVEWLNTAGPISLKEDLRGKVVLLDFWTFCCINCMHVLPDLAYLEEKYPNELVVIGVHSAKFDNEKETSNIRKAILRYEIAHPVINDAEMVVWRKFAVRAWPTLVLIDPEGFYCGYISGEGNRELLDQVMTRLLAHHRAKGTLDETPVRFDLERQKQPPTPLKFPGKVLADAASNRLFISDSNHNRIVVTSLTGQLQHIIGTGAIGSKDGGYDVAQFDHPQGMALVGEKLYVADTENHLIRVVDLATKTVTTLAGTGEQGERFQDSNLLRKVGLNSPWDVLQLDGVLYVAMAGPHQIWSHEIGSNTIQPYAGSGREDITNGPLNESALAQPSGMATDGRFLYVVDSEGSAVRKITTKPDNDLKKPTGSVTTLVGTSDLPGGRSLFEFGDVDAIGNEARLQHPLGLAIDGNLLYVADSYNHKIKRINLTTRESATWLGTGKAGTAVDVPQFAEPAGLSIAQGKLFVADTNNHRICVVDLETKKTQELTIDGLTPPSPPKTTDDLPSMTAIDVEPQKVATGRNVEFAINLVLPEGYKLNPQAAVTYRVTAQGTQSLIAADALNARDEATTEGTTAKIALPLAAKSGAAKLQVAVWYTYCRDGQSGLCKLGTTTWNVPVEVSSTATATVIPLMTPPVK
ncbi:MAG TPA: thioredoxin-like domain-containing protein [Planctomycetaceae bacterium]|nr:thioredoxin-like domain-containing protein [Planctomycetaceae bacterium]